MLNVKTCFCFYEVVVGEQYVNQSVNQGVDDKIRKENYNKAIVHVYCGDVLNMCVHLLLDDAHFVSNFGFGKSRK